MIALNAIATFVHEFMVGRAQQYQILHTGFATIGPMLNVVSIYKPVVSAAGKAQPLSRAHSARLIAVVIVRTFRPTFSGSPLSFSTNGISEPSQHKRRTDSD